MSSAGHRPALVLSPAVYNVQDKPDDPVRPMYDADQELSIRGRSSSEARRSNVVLADQVKSLDWRIRKAVRKGAVSPDS